MSAKSEIQVISIEDQEDGSAILHVKMSEDAQNVFFGEGIRSSLQEMGKHMIVEKPSGDMLGIKRIEISSEGYNAFIQIGLLAAIKEMVENLENASVK